MMAPAKGWQTGSSFFVLKVMIELFGKNATIRDECEEVGFLKYIMNYVKKGKDTGREGFYEG